MRRHTCFLVLVAYLVKRCHYSRLMPLRSESVTLTIGAQGRVVIPARFRSELGLTPGTPLVVSLEDGRIVLERRERILRRLRDQALGWAPRDESVVDALIAERREEARREAESAPG